MSDPDPQDRRREVSPPAVEPVRGRVGQVRPHLDRGRHPFAEETVHEIRTTAGVEVPVGVGGQDRRPARAQRFHGDLQRVGPGQPGSSLMVVEGSAQGSIQRIGRIQVPRARDGEAEENRGCSGRRHGSEGADAAAGQDVQEGCAGEDPPPSRKVAEQLRHTGDVAGEESGAGWAVRDSRHHRVLVELHPPLGQRQPRSQPPLVRSGAGPDVEQGDLIGSSGAQVLEQRRDQSVEGARSGGGVGLCAGGEPGEIDSIAASARVR